MTDKDRPLILISKLFSSNITNEENQELLDWLNKDFKNKIMFDELKKIWTASGSYEADFTPDINSAQERFRARVQINENENKWHGFSYIIKVAAVITIFLIAGTLIYYFVLSGKNNEHITTLTASNNSKAEYTLPDSSKVWLNKNSIVSYRENFEERELSLKGEAFFDVKKVNGKTFKIKSGETTVTVLGTSFVVKSDSSNSTVEVIVLTGKVSFAENNYGDKSKVMLTPGEKGVYSGKKISVSKNEDPNFMAWKTNTLSFKNTPIKEALKTLELFYNKKIIITDEAASNICITSTFNNQSLNDVLDEIQILLSLECRIEADKVILSKIH